MSEPDEDVRRLTSAVDHLQRLVRSLEARVAVLEGTADTSMLPADQSTAALVLDPDADADNLRPAATRAFFLLGRAILVLAGAFLLRTLTDSGTLPVVVGFPLGVLYALALIALADRAGSHDDKAGAVGYGLTAALVAYPFLLETTSLLKIVSPAAGGLALLVISGAGMLVAARQRLRLLSWAFVLAALATTLALNLALDAPLFFASLLLVIFVGTLLLAYTREWRLERWFAALATDAVIVRLVLIAADPGDPVPGAVLPAAGGTMALALALLVVNLGIFSFRALVQNKGVSIFYVTQSSAVLFIGYGGAVRLAQAGVGGADLLGWLALIAALTYYTVAFTVVHRRHGRGRGFFYFASMGLIFLVLGSRVIAAGDWLGWSWLALGLAAAILGGRFRRVTLRAHSAVYLALAVVQTGLLAGIWDAFLGGADGTWRRPGLAGLATLAATAAAYLVMISTLGKREITNTRRIPQFVLALLALGGLGYAAVTLLVRLGGEAPPAAADHVVAVVRTGVLAVTVVALAVAGRRTGWFELTWPVFPLLALGCVKLLIEDLRRGTPLTLTIGFALFGTALIVAPRVLLAGRKTAADAAQAAPAEENATV